MTEKPDEGVPALQNDDVTGMTEDKQKEIIARSGRTDRPDAAKEFYDEQEDQAGTSTPPAGKDRQPSASSGPSMDGHGTQGEKDSEFEHRWKDAAAGSASPNTGDKGKKKS